MTDIERIDRPAPGGNAAMAWGSDIAAEMLRRLGIEYIALNPGASFRGFHDSLVNYLGNRDPQLLLCLHEDHALAIAHGYAKATDRAMAVMLHANVGLMHGLLGIFNAWCDRLPVYVMGASGPADACNAAPGSSGSTHRKTRARCFATVSSGTTSRARLRHWWKACCGLPR